MPRHTKPVSIEPSSGCSVRALDGRQTTPAGSLPRAVDARAAEERERKKESHMAEEQSASPTKRASWRGYVQLLPDTGLAGPKPPKSPEDPQSPDQSPISRRRRSLKKAKTVRDLEQEASKERALSMHREEAGPPETIPADDWEKWVGKAGDVIFPNEQWKLIWDFVLLTFIMYSCVVVPFRLGMNHAAEGEWWNFEVAITVFFITDLVLTFRVAVAEGDELIIDKASIRRVYMQFWFWVDASSSFPVEVFELAAKLADADGSGGNHHNRWQLSMLKLLRGLRLLRLLRLLKVFKLKIYMQIIEERLRFNVRERERGRGAHAARARARLRPRAQPGPAPTCAPAAPSTRPWARAPSTTHCSI